MQPHRRRASSTADARRQVQCPQRASSTGPSRLRRSVSHLVRELRGIYSNRSVVAWGAPLIRWNDDGAIILAAHPIASLLAGLVWGFFCQGVSGSTTHLSSVVSLFDLKA